LVHLGAQVLTVDEDRQAAEASRRIMAVILTHNAPESLERCLQAIAAQTVPPESVLVVDNASHPVAIVASGYPIPVTLVRSEVNTGPAGGYATALAKFVDSDYLHAWVLDDDMLPESACLEHLWSIARTNPETAFVFPISEQVDGSRGVWPSWCGFVISRQIVAAVGLPMAELFWWAEDTEYLQYRIPEAGYERQVAHEAVVHHEAVRQGDVVPLWKYYYESRNMLYVHLHVKRRLGWYPRNVTKLVARSILRQGSGRIRRLVAIARGLSDGARGRLGLRFPVEPMAERQPDRTPGGA
jgi:rhamnopyranosyl-N-acetylglucosaminyl-diphospho-decaprenol beta-1,3/1,4-galactofuranosyltransferase